MRAAVLLSCAVLLACLACTGANIVQVSIAVDDRRLIPITDAFGYANGGQLEFTISQVSIYKQHVTSAEPNLDKMGFFLSDLEADTAIEEEELVVEGAEFGSPGQPGQCILSELTNNKLPRFSDSAIRKVIDAKANITDFEYEIETGGQYYLYFVNCEPNTPVSFEMTVTMYNYNGAHQRNYLSVGEGGLETVYWVFFSLFTAGTGLWLWYSWRHKAHAQRIHWLMGLLGAVKALTIMTQAIMLNHIKRHGSADGWNIVYYFFTAFRGILFFTVIVLIGTGWSYMKPFLGDREKRILMVVIPLQVFANIAIVVMDEENVSASDWFTWRDLFHLVDIICCCAILFPIVWSIRNLREAAETDGKAARSLEKLELFRQFYVVVVVYIYFTRIIVYLLRSTLPYELIWIAEACNQMATLLFYVWTAWKFAPTEQNPYLKLQQAEIEMSS